MANLKNVWLKPETAKLLIDAKAKIMLSTSDNVSDDETIKQALQQFLKVI